MPELEAVSNDPVDALYVGWDDIQGNVAGGTLHPTATPTWRDYDYSIDFGVAFRTLGFAIGNVIYGTVQTPHAMMLNSTLHAHIHVTTPTDGTGKKFKFQMDVIACGVDGTYSVPAGSPFTVETSMTEDWTDTQKVIETGMIPSANTTVSSLYKIKMTRIAASSDEYAGEVYVDFMDAHYQRDQSRGSRQEYVK